VQVPGNRMPMTTCWHPSVHAAQAYLRTLRRQYGHAATALAEPRCMPAAELLGASGLTRRLRAPGEQNGAGPSSVRCGAAMHEKRSPFCKPRRFHDPAMVRICQLHLFFFRCPVRELGCSSLVVHC
jgi:hypothetical protein